MQDYLPPRYLIEALQLNFKDDQSENVMDFDPNIEFWDYSQISEKRIQYCSENKWHFSMK